MVVAAKWQVECHVFISIFHIEVDDVETRWEEITCHPEQLVWYSGRQSPYISDTN
jgi:hypothetical protein